LSRLRREVRTLNQKIRDCDLKIERLEGRVTLLALGQSGEVAPAPKTPAVGATPQPEPEAKKKTESQPKISQLTGPQRSLPVVKLGSEEEGRIDQGAVDDGSPPIVIKLTGAPGEDGDYLPIYHHVLRKPDPVLDAPKKATADDDDPNQAPPKKVTKAEIKAAYEIALAKLRIDGDADAARKLLKRFTRRYPNSEYVDNVAYWMAECDFTEHEYAKAAKGFQKMIDVYPRSTKVPDAIVRQAEARMALEQDERASVLLRRVIAQHPESEAAKKAKALLQGARGRR
jgi:tol-pal system protein YbgF